MRRIVDWLPAVVVFCLGIAAWQWLLPDVLHVQSFLLPRFSDVMRALWDERDALRARCVDHVQGGALAASSSGAAWQSWPRSSSRAGVPSATR